MRTLGDVGAGHTLGRYELLVPIARGGMAVVWAARMKGSRGFQKLVAVKSMLPTLSDDTRFEEMFLAEAALASQIHHPNVCEILDLGEQEGVLFIVMELVEGEPLHVIQKAARKSGGIPLGIAARLAKSAAEGLHAAHELRGEDGELVGVVHRDVSPQNILVTYEGVVKIVDFGIAKATQAEQGKTAVGVLKGKATYMAPEQARGQALDRRTDVFALGIVLYALVTGKHPFRQDTEIATLGKITDKTAPPAPSTIVPTCPPALDAAIMRALAKQPDDRFATMQEFASALDGALSRMTSHGPDVATFVKGVVGENAGKKRAIIREAQRVADERRETMTSNPNISGLSGALLAIASSSESSGPLSESGRGVSSSGVSSSGLTGVSASGISGLSSSGTPSRGGRAPDSGDPTRHLTPLDTSAPAVTRTDARGVVDAPPSSASAAKSRSPWPWIAIAMLAAAGIAAFTMMRNEPSSRSSVSSSAVAAPAAAPTTAAVESAAQSAKATAAPPDEPAPSASASADHRARPGHGWPPHAPGAHTAAPAGSGSPNAPKILNPGF